MTPSHLSPSHLSPLASLSPLTSHLSPLTSHLSPLTSHLSPLTSPPLQSRRDDPDLAVPPHHRHAGNDQVPAHACSPCLSPFSVRSPRHRASQPDDRSSGSSLPWWERGRPPWRSTGWSTSRSTRGIHAPPRARCPRARCPAGSSRVHPDRPRRCSSSPHGTEPAGVRISRRSR